MIALHLVARVFSLPAVVLMVGLAVAPLGAAVQTASPGTNVPLAPPVASYDIVAKLDADGATLHGQETIRYENVSPDTLNELYLHLYLNAFRSADTPWMREAGAGHRGFPFDAADAGSIDVDRFAVGDHAVALDLDEAGTMARSALSTPLLPSQAITLTVSWTARLPRVFARTGWAPGGFTMVGQWYPKLAVYDARRGGRDREPWHANAEFFADFGQYDLTLTVPAARATVVANGEPSGAPRENGDGTTTWRFRADGVTDVVWMAAERYVVRAETAGEYSIFVALPAEVADAAPRHVAIARYVLDRYAAWLGPYPWPRLTIVVPPPNGGAAGGMEYPSLITAAPVTSGLPPGLHELEVVVAHEIAHQWFPMQVATNEARDPWLDEAFADYLTQRVLGERFGPDRSAADLPIARIAYVSELRLGFANAARLPIDKPSWEYTREQYGAAIYAKGALFLATLERVFGSDRFTAALSDYVTQWRWRHPLPADFRLALEARLGSSPARIDPDGTFSGVDPWLDQIASGDRILDVRVGEVAPGHAVVERTGDAALPIKGVAHLASGGTLAWQLGAEESRIDLEPPAGDRFVAVAADPDRALLVEPNRIDDDRSIAPQTGALAGFAGLLAALIALLLQSLGQFG